MRSFSISELSVMSDIVNLAHTNPLSGESWAEMLGLIARVIPVDAAGGVLVDQETRRPYYHVLHCGVDEGFYGEYEKHYRSKDVVTQAAAAQGIHVWRPTDVVPKSVWERTEIYNGLLAKNDLRHPMSLTVGDEDGLMGQLWLVRAKGSKPFSSDDMVMMKCLHPHMLRACTKAKALDRAKRQMSFFQAGFDHIARPAFVLDQSFKVGYMNIHARRVCFAEDGRDTGVRSDVESAVSGMMKQNAPCTDTLCVLGGRKRRLSVFPVRDADAPVHYIAVLEDAKDYFRLAFEEMRRQYRLTAREMEVCRMLARGLTNREIAARLYISQFTVEDHVKSILEKLKISSRSKIAAKLFEV